MEIKLDKIMEKTSMEEISNSDEKENSKSDPTEIINYKQSDKIITNN